MSDSEVDVCVLISTKEDENSFRQYIGDLEEWDNNFAFFFDPDQCVEFILSIRHNKCLLVLGKSYCHLVDIFSTFPCIFYIYLTEARYYKDASRVRCISFTPEELLVKLKQDITMLEKNDLIFSISSSKELKMNGSTTKDVCDDELAFCYIHAMLVVLLHTAKSTNNIHEDMLQECRAGCNGNAKQLEKVDEFEKTYESKKAILWYTKDSFLYRQLNAALRKENMLTIWKFRCIIQDIYRQLEALHNEQSTSHNIHRLYRGQHMTSNEFKQIKDSVGHLIAMNSFLSTTQHRNVAEIWAGNGEDRPKLESVLFEITIDESEFEDLPVIFADITKESNFREEGEVLLVMGTTLRIESVEPEGNIWKISFRACPFENRIYRELKSRLLKFDELLIFDENISRLMIGHLLLSMGDIEKAEQITQWVNHLEHPFAKYLDTYIKIGIDLRKMTTDSTETNQYIRLRKNLSKLKESAQTIKEFVDPNNMSYLNMFQAVEQMADVFMTEMSRPHFNISTVIGCAMPYLDEESRSQDLSSRNDTMRPRDLTRCRTEATDIPTGENKPSRLPNFEQLKSIIDRSCIKKDPMRNYMLNHIAWEAARENDKDKSMKCLEEALSAPCDDDQRAITHLQQAHIYAERKNYRAALETCEPIFNMPRLSEKSPMLLLAHELCAPMCQQFQDNRNALLHYQKAVQLRCQHHSPHDPMVSADKMAIALIFLELEDKDAALEIFEEVVQLGYSKDTSIAYERMGLIYLLKGDCDMAHYCFTQSLEIAQGEDSPDLDLVIKNHLHFAKMEHVRKNFDQVDVHLNEALVISNNYPCTEKMKKEIEHTLNVLRPLCARGHIATK